MNSPADSHEMTILESKGILIQDQIFHAVLTNKRIILTIFSDNKLNIRSIFLPEIQKTEIDTDDAGDPVMQVFTQSVEGEIKKIAFHFSQKNFPDPHQVSSLWASEINALIHPTIPFSQADIPKKSPSTPAVCGSCGNSITDGSVFCNLCGTKIIYPAQPLPLGQRDARIQDTIIAPKISTGDREPAPEKISISDADNSDAGENIPVMEPLHKEQKKKESFFTRSGPRQPAIIAISAVVGILIVIAVLFMFVPSVSPGSNLTSPGTNSSIPEVTDSMSATNPLVTTPTIPETTTTLTATPVQTSTNLQTKTPVQTTVPQGKVVQPVFTSAPGDPAMVLVSYPSLFNAADGAGIYALLAEDIKSQYPLEYVNSELDAAHSNGYTIENIDVRNQIVAGSDATLIVEVTWNMEGSSQTSIQNLLMVYENNQWKLNTLILYP